jgi:hypothetical protein
MVYHYTAMIYDSDRGYGSGYCMYVCILVLPSHFAPL